MLQIILTKKLLKQLDTIEFGSLSLTLPDGKTYNFQGAQDGHNAQATIHDLRTISAYMRKGDIGLAESYRDGWWDCDDIAELFMFGFQNWGKIGQDISSNLMSKLATRLQYMMQQNTLKGSKRNIHAHYNIGNEFYKLWLDPSMTYSSALYKEENETLEAAQNNKYDRILDRLDTPTGHVLEVGCGWGGFADRLMVRNDNDYNLKGITISQEQHHYAKHRMDKQANIVLEDYRHQTGKYDYLVSIEMFEAVGEKFWPTYFTKMKSLLSEKGQAVIQTITINDKSFEHYRKSGDIFRSFIFPGGMLPSPSRFKAEANKAGLEVTDEFSFGQDYAKTCEEWLNRFNKKEQEVRALGMDNKFIRLWRIYLATCIATFRSKTTDVMHMELRHAV